MGHLPRSASTYPLESETPFVLKRKPFEQTVRMTILFKDFFLLDYISASSIGILPYVGDTAHVEVYIMSDNVFVLLVGVCCRLLCKDYLLSLRYYAIWAHFFVY